MMRGDQDRRAWMKQREAALLTGDKCWQIILILWRGYKDNVHDLHSCLPQQARI